MKDWFISHEEQVTGPYTMEEVQKQINQGHVLGDHLIWSRSQPDWKSVAWWIAELPNLKETQQSSMEEEAWHYAVADTSHGPMNRGRLVEELATLTNQKSVLVWTKGMKAWTSIYEFHDLLDEIGVNRRVFPRASISGQAVVNLNDQSYIGQLCTISEGGIGAKGFPQLSAGQIVQVEIKSTHFPNTISAKATIQYVSAKGFVGFKFDNIHMEAKSSIIEYVKGYALSNAA